MTLMGLIVLQMAVLRYAIEKESLWTTKVIVEDVNTFLWIQVPSFIGVILGLVSVTYRKPILGWLMVGTGIVVLIPKLLVVSSSMAFYGGLLYIVSGAIVLLKKESFEKLTDMDKKGRNKLDLD